MDEIDRSSSISEVAECMLKERVSFLIPIANEAAKLTEKENSAATILAGRWISNLVGQSVALLYLSETLGLSNSFRKLLSETTTELDAAELLLLSDSFYHERFSGAVQAFGSREEIKVAILAMFVEQRFVDAMPVLPGSALTESFKASSAKRFRRQLQEFDLDGMLDAVAKISVPQQALPRMKQRFHRSKIIALSCILSVGGCAETIIKHAAKEDPLVFNFVLDYLISAQVRKVCEKRGLNPASFQLGTVRDSGLAEREEYVKESKKRIQSLYSELQEMNDTVAEAISILKWKRDVHE